ncbi:HPP family-domain-containing protein [Gloeopeniophorella convolvens]|nr:HPP family-domain-containing protein [Gloeopeniophorella convolvens]
MSSQLPEHHQPQRPRNVLARLPRWASRWLGYRHAPPKPLPEYLVWGWSWIGAFCGLAVIMAVFGQAHTFTHHHPQVPILIASYGASAVLIYGAIDAPLAQPRALICGHFIGALIGVCIAKLFGMLPPARFEDLRWLCAALAGATAVVAMQITRTTHPPAGATAVLPTVDAAVGALGWYFLPVVLLSSALALGVALVVNNLQRRYPVFWLTPAKPPRPAPPPSAPLGDLASASTSAAPTVDGVPPPDAEKSAMPADPAHMV